MKLEKLNIQGIEDIYLISNVKKEFAKAVNDGDYKRAISVAKLRLRWLKS